MFVVGAFGTIGSWPLMKVVGRRTLYLWGECALAAIMLITGVLASAAPNNKGASYTVSKVAPRE
jgi:SP family general alpha glucoside:H+ symporter-like MFS transporter